MNLNKKKVGKESRKRGYRAENFAVLFLRLKGYKILERNFKPPRGTGAGEIDIIALKQNVIIFVEVKQRLKIDLAAEAINENVQSRRIRGAEYFLMLHPEFSQNEMRFDAILLSPGRLPVHIRNAFMSP